MKLNPHADHWTINCPAKLNLFLEVLKKRADGYHDIDTVMAAVNIYDTLIIKKDPTDQVTLHCNHAATRHRQFLATDAVPNGPSNLVMKSVELMKSISRKPTGLRLALIKRTPAAAGMAGGSSDAAAAIIALNEIWQTYLPRAELQSIASQLGSDVAFFVSPTTVATCRGRGELLTSEQHNARMHFVIARPKSGLSTADVYRNCKPSDNARDSRALVQSLRTGNIKDIASHIHNSLQPVAEKLNPEITQLRLEFNKLPVFAHMMTGSGTAYFGICQTKSQAASAAARLKAIGIDRVFVAHCPP